MFNFIFQWQFVLNCIHKHTERVQFLTIPLRTSWNIWNNSICSAVNFQHNQSDKRFLTQIHSCYKQLYNYFMWHMTNTNDNSLQLWYTIDAMNQMNGYSEAPQWFQAIAVLARGRTKHLYWNVIKMDKHMYRSKAIFIHSTNAETWILLS